jgi:nicotinamide-nucleotide adenylyltransferase
MDKIGVIHGRFQMLHMGHMEYLIAGKNRCDRLIIGICNPDENLTKFNNVCPHRSKAQSNPLTYFERYEMIKGAMIEAGHQSFDIVPFPINFPSLIFNYVPKGATFYMTIYDKWGEEKKYMLENIGCNVEVMWYRTDDERFTSGTEVRSRIINQEKWEELVPPFVYKYVVEHGIDKRIRME